MIQHLFLCAFGSFDLLYIYTLNEGKSVYITQFHVLCVLVDMFCIANMPILSICIIWTRDPEGCGKYITFSANTVSSGQYFD